MCPRKDRDREIQLDIGVGYGFIAPTGPRRANRPSLPGKEYWTHYPVYGLTYYFDEERTWTAADHLDDIRVIERDDLELALFQTAGAGKSC